MPNQSTMDKLIEMRLTAMADAFRSQLNDPKFKEIPFEDQFGMLVDIEYSSRKNNRLKRLIKINVDILYRKRMVLGRTLWTGSIFASENLIGIAVYKRKSC